MYLLHVLFRLWDGYFTKREGIENHSEDDTIKKTEDKGIVEVHIVGKIDRNIYKCITDDIVTDEVIIIDERIRHIQERHPNDYEDVIKNMSEALAYPALLKRIIRV